MEQKQWAGSTYGSGWMHRCLIRSLRFIDVRFLYLFSAIFVIPVCLVLNESRKRHRIQCWCYLRIARKDDVIFSIVIRFHAIGLAQCFSVVISKGQRIDCDIDTFTA